MTAIARCPRCGWPADETGVRSTHRTSQGVVDYRRCVCGVWLVLVNGRLVRS